MHNSKPELTKKWKDRKQGNLLIVNSVVRHKPTEVSIDEAYSEVLKHSFVDTILMGSMNHIKENIKIFDDLHI